MSQQKIALKDDSLNVRFQKALGKLNKEKELMEKICKRNLLQIIFSNNTRDLANAAIAQNELISELNTAFQDLLRMLSESKKTQAEIVQELDLAINSQISENALFKDKLLIAARKAVELSGRIFQLENISEDHEKRIASNEQIEKMLLSIREISGKEGCSSVKQFCEICECIRKFFTSAALSHDDKRKILITIKECHFGRISVQTLNENAEKVCRIFEGVLSQKQSDGRFWWRFLTGDRSLKHWKDEYKMDEIISGIIDTVATSESDRYIEFRNTLVTILDEFLDKKIDVNEEHAPELIAIRKRLCESQFEIALVGEFQGGKSTTFNMLCGGREISPRGLNGGGIKTSAAVVTAQNIDGDETQNGFFEWAEISWLNIDEVKRRIGSVLKAYDAEKAEQKKLQKKVEDTNTADFEFLFRAAWAKAPQGDALDQLRVATLQFRLLSDPNLQKYLSQKIVAIDRFQRLVIFPSNWEKRWENKFDANFTTEEGLFSIVDRVLVRIHSPALARLGCRITDCPGLFVSQWDTDRAISVMRHSNAIWYLLSGEKQIGKNDLQALEQIKAYQWKDKCFFSINRRKSRNSSMVILDNDISALKNNGFYPEQIYMYDAFLAFRIAQSNLVKNNFTVHDFECLAEETAKGRCFAEVLAELNTDPSACEHAIKKIVVKHLMTIDEEELGDVLSKETSFSPELLERVRCESGIGEILTAIEKMIITKRARSILVSEGSQQCLEVLTHLQAQLKNREKAAEQTLQEAKHMAEEALGKLEKFLEEWENNFAFIKLTALDDGLAMDFFQEYDREIKDTICNKAIKICKEEWHGPHWDASDVNSAVEERIQAEFIGLIKAKLECYRNDITHKPKFKETIGALFTARILEMKDHWHELKTGNELFDSIETVNEEDCNAFKFETFDQKLDGSIDVPWYTWELIKDVFTLGFRRLFQTPDDRIEEFFKKRDPVGQAYDAFKGDTENEKQIAYALGATRRAYQKCLDDSFTKMKQRLDSNITEREKTVKLSNEEREQIAKRAKETRKNIVDPYTERIQAFQNEVYRFYAE